ncbi:syntaxin-binding protein 5 [Phtheirospermum japonicum]|uniref:Syntaxin-binding protein 5 n=1 Tax=Phtheirospermum japonicum TaxID=374723 RepID=A0A830BKN5_9LAMI|nr:syntaxin-binding protein 5 [Phtheirospermum japonicum]
MGLQQQAGFSDSLDPDDVSPHLVFHYGIPSGSMLLAYDSIQQILAISTKAGQIKLFGKDGSQALFESSETVPGKFLLVWDLDRKCLSGVHHFEKDITSFAAMRSGPYLYVGDSSGDIALLMLHQEQCHVEKMNYHIPLSASHGKANEAGSDVAAKFVLPQPTAETKRVLIIYSDGGITLWAIRESKVIFSSCGGTALQSTYQEAKKVTAACWACPAGTKVVVGYSNGDITLWSVPSPSDSKTEQASQNELCGSQITSIYKLNLGYKADKIPIAKLKWVDADGKSSRLYVLGCSEFHSANLFQVVLLNENTETRTIKLGLHLPESLVDLEIMTSPNEQNKYRCDCLLLLGSSSHVYAYDDSLVERYLVQCQTKSSPSLPKEVKLKLPYGDSSITVSKFITSLPCMQGSTAEDFSMLAKSSLPLFPFERRVKDGCNSNSTTFSPFSNARNLLITGHSSGAINFWDASCPLLLPVAYITQQSDNDFAVSGVPLTALHFSYESRILVSGDQSGMVRIHTLKSEAFAPQSTLVPFQGKLHFLFFLGVDILAATSMKHVFIKHDASVCATCVKVAVEVAGKAFSPEEELYDPLFSKEVSESLLLKPPHPMKGRPFHTNKRGANLHFISRSVNGEILLGPSHPLGSSKKGSNHIIRRIKVVKVNGSVLCISTTENLKQLAVGSDQGYVSLIDSEGPSVLYQTQIASEFCTGIISMHFETCSFHGFEKNVIIAATNDSSLVTLERDTGNTLSSGVVHPNKPSVALFTCIMDGHGTSSRGSGLPDGTEINNTTSDNFASKQSCVLLCSEKAVYAYSLLQLVQGVKKVLYKKKFSSSCYWASTFGSPDIGLILLFASGKIEIRSLPELSLVKNSSIRALTFSTLRPPSTASDITVSSSPGGDLIIINGDQELLFVSTLLHKEAYRHMDSVSKVLNKDLVNSQGLISLSPIKEKKKGIFGSMVKDNKGTKGSNGLEPETQASRQSVEELSTLFSAVNLPTNTDTEEKLVMYDSDVDLDIDDIEIEDPKEKPRGYLVVAGFNRHNITNKFQAIKGKLKKGKTDKVPETDEPQDENTGAVDQIKKKYGYTSGESNVANMAKTKLSENLRKLQRQQAESLVVYNKAKGIEVEVGINMKTTEMQDTARSFSSMAKDVLRFAENEKKRSSS